MKLALISDIHANLEALTATFDDIAWRKVDRIVCLGDIAGYNTRPAECIALIRKSNALCVAGNHDLAVCGRIQTRHFGTTAARALAWTQQRLARDELDYLRALPLKAVVDGKLIAVHGALHPQIECATVRLDNAERRLQSFQALIADPSGARICAFGHTHRSGIYEFREGRVVSCQAEEFRLRPDAYYLLNPGTVGQPRGRNPRASYMIVDLAQQIVRLHRVRYDAAVSRAATRQAGLAPAFSFVPAPLRSAIAASLRVFGLDRPIRQVAGLLGL
ncbi:MAG: metallophosphoesterase family protein [Xanthobacteraceae bacterium]